MPLCTFRKDTVNPRLDLLQPYPFEKLRALFANVAPNPALKPISLSIGEPKHATPTFIKQALTDALIGLASYPTTLGEPFLREAIAVWLKQRYALPNIDAATQVLPVNGSREALFAFAQTVLDPQDSGALVLCPNPFYQIYEGAALLAGAQPYFVNSDPARNFACDYSQIPSAIWKKVRLVYACSPGNPTGAVMSLEEWKTLFALSAEYGFVIAADECYSEIYFEEGTPPLGALQAAQQLGLHDFDRLVVFSSLSKRSNVPGLRSGFVAGDASLLKKFLLYRTYHGNAMNPAIQHASAAAWKDEAHVVENRTQYRQKFAEITPILAQVMDVKMPDAAFYLWAKTPIADDEYARRLYQQYNVTVLPGSFLARESTPGDHTSNPGTGRIRIALVAGLNECRDAAQRIAQFTQSLSTH